MLSILIPTYNHNIIQLVKEIYEQISKLDIPFEILCLDDGSTDKYIIALNNNINTLTHTTYLVLDKNIGRSAIRNKLAKEAKFDWLLFLDADVLPKNQDFITNYLNAITIKSQIIYGGILYREEKPKESELLRWVYGQKREALPVSKREKNPYLTFLTLNFLIKKSVFLDTSFNEDIPNLRHEDTLFSYNLKIKNISVEHIENPTFHLGLEESERFLTKSLESIDALYLFLEQGLITEEYTKITRVYSKLKKNGLNYLLALLYILFNHFFKKNLLCKNPSLLIFDIYRLSYLCKLDFK